MPFRKIIVTVVGSTILAFGLVLLVLPGPAFVVIPIGLAVLATEFVWARRWLRRAKGMVNQRKARRTSRAVWLTCRRKWDRFRLRFSRWFRVASTVPIIRPEIAKQEVGMLFTKAQPGPDGTKAETTSARDSAPSLNGSPTSTSATSPPLSAGPH